MGVGHFVSPEGRTRFLAAYRSAMATLPEPVETHDIETEFGSVRAYRFSGKPGPNLVLLPGRNGTSAMFEPNVPALAERYCVYTIDPLGEPGMSVQTVRLRCARDQARWLGGVLAGMGLDRAHLVGVSFGGWLAINQVLHAPERVASVSMLDPANVLARFSSRMMVAALATAPMAPRAWRTRFLSWISGDAQVSADDPIAGVIQAGMNDYKLAIPAPSYPDDSALRSITVPVLAVIAGRSTLHDPRKALARARATLPDVRAELWQDASHAISGEYAESVNTRLSEFIDDVERHPKRPEN